MIIVNFSHPLTDDQRKAIAMAAGEEIERLIEVPAHFNEEEPYIDQVRRLAGETGLTAEEWQAASILLNPPAYAPIAVALQAYLHGLCGDFLPAIRLRPAVDSPVRRFEFAEILDLQKLYRGGGREDRNREGTHGG